MTLTKHQCILNYNNPDILIYSFCISDKVNNKIIFLLLLISSGVCFRMCISHKQMRAITNEWRLLTTKHILNCTYKDIRINILNYSDKANITKMNNTLENANNVI